MSIAAVNHVRTLRGLTPTERAMLFTLAGYCGVKTGLAWPSIAALAADNELSKRRTWEILHELEEKNRITREHKGPAGRQVTFYQIVGVVPQEVAQEPAQEASPPPAESRTPPPAESRRPPCEPSQAPLRSTAGPPAESRSANKEERVFKGYRKEEQGQPLSLSLEKIAPQPSAFGVVDWPLIASGVNGNGRGQPRMSADTERTLNNLAAMAKAGCSQKTLTKMALGALPESWIVFLNLRRSA